MLERFQALRNANPLSFLLTHRSMSFSVQYTKAKE
jgi:hypothetical protein